MVKIYKFSDHEYRYRKILFWFLGWNSMDMCKIYGLFLLSLLSVHYILILSKKEKKGYDFFFRLCCVCSKRMCVVALNGQNINKGQMWPARISPMNRKRFFIYFLNENELNGFVGQNGYCYIFCVKCLCCGRNKTTLLYQFFSLNVLLLYREV